MSSVNHQLPLEALHLRRSFGRKNVTAVDDVSLRISSGQVVALLGPNGAGKTTSIKMCGTMLAPSSGSVSVDGVDAIVHPRAARNRLGVVLGGDGGFYGRSSVRTNLLFFADVAGISSAHRERSVERALASVGLTSRRDSRVRELSRGMMQRLHLARALLNDPRLLLLDEPTNGLDPEYALEVRALVREIATDGAGILLTTHLLGEAEALADHVVVIDRGRVLVEGSVRSIGDAAGIERVSTVSVRAERDARLLSDAAAGIALAVEERSLFGRTHLRIEWRRSSDEIEFSHWLDGRDGAPVEYASRGPTLEESYLALTTSHDRDRSDPNS